MWKKTTFEQFCFIYLFYYYDTARDLPYMSTNIFSCNLFFLLIARWCNFRCKLSKKLLKVDFRIISSYKLWKLLILRSKVLVSIFVCIYPDIVWVEQVSLGSQTQPKWQHFAWDEVVHTVVLIVDLKYKLHQTEELYPSLKFSPTILLNRIAFLAIFFCREHTACKVYAYNEYALNPKAIVKWWQYWLKALWFFWNIFVTQCPAGLDSLMRIILSQNIRLKL